MLQNVGRLTKDWSDLNILTFQGPSASQTARHTDAGYCDPRTHYSTLQPRTYSARPGQYDPSQARCCNTYTSVTLQQNSRSAVTIQGKYHQHNPNMAIKHKLNSPSPGGDEEVQIPLLSSSSSPTSGPTISTVSSTVSSSELNHSLTSSDASEFSSERDRESEVWWYQTFLKFLVITEF